MELVEGRRATENKTAAQPVLASSLLDAELRREAVAKSRGIWRTGISGLDNGLPSELWASGKVIGVAAPSTISLEVRVAFEF